MKSARSVPTTLADKAVAITGAGTIGAAICKACLARGAERLLILDNWERALEPFFRPNLWGGHPRIDARLADVRDRDRLDRLLTSFKPDLLFHTAGISRPLPSPADWGEIVKTNLFGSVNLIEVSDGIGCRTVLVNCLQGGLTTPSILTGTKLFAELYAQSMAEVSQPGAGDGAGLFVSLRIPIELLLYQHANQDTFAADREDAFADGPPIDELCALIVEFTQFGRNHSGKSHAAYEISENSVWGRGSSKYKLDPVMGTATATLNDLRVALTCISDAVETEQISRVYEVLRRIVFVAA